MKQHFPGVSLQVFPLFFFFKAGHLTQLLRWDLSSKHDRYVRRSLNHWRAAQQAAGVPVPSSGVIVKTQQAVTSRVEVRLRFLSPSTFSLYGNPYWAGFFELARSFWESPTTLSGIRHYRTAHGSSGARIQTCSLLSCRWKWWQGKSVWHCLVYRGRGANSPCTREERAVVTWQSER